MISLLKRNTVSGMAKISLLSTALLLLLAQQSFAANVLKDIKSNASQDGKTAITLQFEQAVGEVKAFSTDNPPRIAIDFPDTNNAYTQKKLLLSTGLAKSVSATEAGGRTRVLVDLAKITAYRTQAVGSSLVLILDANPAAQAVVNVAGIDFKRGDNGEARLVIRFDDKGAVPHFTERASQVVLDISNAKLPADLRRRMDVAGFDTPMASYEARSINGNTRVTVNTKGQNTAMAYQTGNEYVLEISPKQIELSGTKNAASVAKTGAITSGSTTARYTGKPVTFNFQDVPVRTVLQLIAEESGLNLVAADSVGGNVTLRLINVPWDQALEIVLRAKGLDKRRDGNVIWVAPQSELASFEQAREDARIALETREETVTEYIPINYGNAEDIAKLLTENSKSGTGGGGAGGGGVQGQQQRGFLSPRGSVSFDARTNTLLLIDIPKKIVEVKQLLRTLDRPVDQVMIEARIVVASDSFARDLGARFAIGSSSTNPANAGKTTGFESLLAVGNAAGILNFTNTSLDVELSAMETKGKGEVISNPRVITSNQKEAIIRQGDEIGYTTTQPSGTSGTPQATVQFKEVLLELKVTPTITQDGRVFLSMSVKKDEVKSFLSTPTGEIPQIQKREVNTAVLIENGQTLVIGGVYEFKNRDDVSKVPFIGDIPFFGNLFKKQGKSLEKAELLIFVTPHIIKPAARAL